MHMILQHRAAGWTHTHTQIQRAASSHPPIQRPKEALAENTNWIQLLEIPGKINVHSHTGAHACTHTAASVLGETQNLLSVLKRKAAVCKVLLQTCARVQEEKD